MKRELLETASPFILMVAMGALQRAAQRKNPDFKEHQAKVQKQRYAAIFMGRPYQTMFG